ncbi:MAG: type IV pilus modification protein PilV [Proteobacteria bacterium]|nr:type IV pilus modification protein PilV [Pseudomonadota bacterium]
MKTCRGPRPVRGFTMVEALVALVVLAVGMLGMAGLYVTTLRSGSSAIYRMQAINLATDMADRIRANHNANLFYNDAPANNPCFGAVATVDCTPEQMAQSDLFQWNAQLTQMLPSGTGTVAVNGASAPYTYTITINWFEQGSDTAVANTAQSYVMTLQI